MELKLLNLIFTWKGTNLPNNRYSRSSLLLNSKEQSPHPVKKLLAIYDTRNFSTVPQNGPTPTPIPSEINPVHGLQCYLISTLTVSYHLRLGLPSDQSPWHFPRQNLTCISISSHTCPQVLPILPRSPPNIIWKGYKSLSGPGSSVGIATELRAGRSGDRFPVRRDFPPVHTGPGAHTASRTMGTGSFPGEKCDRDMLLTTHSFQCRGHGRVELYLYPPSGSQTGL